MSPTFRHVALIGKYHQLSGYSAPTNPAHQPLAEIAEFLHAKGCEVVVEADTALHTGLHQRFPTLTVDELGQHCALAVVVGAMAPCWASAAIWPSTARRWWASTKGAWAL